MGRGTDRDRNDSWNILKIAKRAINKKDRPSYLCGGSNRATLSSGYNQTVHGYEKTQF